MHLDRVCYITKTMSGRSTSKKPTRTFSVKKILIMVVTVVVIMLLSLMVWAKNNIYDSQRFSTTLVSTIKTEETRQAVAGELTDQVFSGRPVAQRLLSQPTQSVVSSLLVNDRFNQLLTKMVANISQRMTLGKTEAIQIDISGFSNGIKAVQQAIAPDTQLNLPTGDAAKITIVKANTLPNLHKPGQLLMLVTPFLALALLAFIVITLFSSQQKSLWLRDSGIVLIASSAILLTLVYSIASYLSTMAQDQNQQIIIQNIFGALVQRFQDFETKILFIGIALATAGQTAHHYGWHRKLWQKSKSRLGR